MTVTAKMSIRFIWRLGLIALICLGGSLYCVYDGAIGYPAQRQRALAFLELKEQGLDRADTLARWREITAERGWPSEEPGKPKEEIDFHIQFFMAGCLAVPGLLYLYFFIRSWSRWIEMNDSGLRTSSGRQLAFDQILMLDKKKWKTKGIAKILYEQNGRRRRMVLDDWKYDDMATKTILREVESRIDPGRIVGGLPEPPEEQPPAAETGD
ncbi:MAG: hypothetical protein JW719_05470 [Pirellulales bacterium]|nr:hypothetical protein [Pirellulales bacterium]